MSTPYRALKKTRKILSKLKVQMLAEVGPTLIMPMEYFRLGFEREILELTIKDLERMLFYGKGSTIAIVRVTIWPD